jgi:ParB-like chromosome segregation protein Spo0J
MRIRVLRCNGPAQARLEPVLAIYESPVTFVSLVALHPAEWNPRLIKDERFQNLCASIQSDPDFLWHRPVLAQVDGTIYAGNMRFRAAQHLGMETIPAVIEDISDQLARERALRDNAQWGEWQEDELAELLY